MSNSSARAFSISSARELTGTEGSGTLEPFWRSARAIGAQMIDSGFESDFLHRWWSAHIRHEEGTTTLSQVLQSASALLNRPPTEYEVLVVFPSPLIPPRGLLPPESWRNATEV